ncbi:30S ribosomal protein S3 [Halolamina pelagica]|uniref:Small ribosomal subunit protein uS3 n=1 Tax=Halolamina pelagica TaxID=699431 RepID=A0A0P7FXC0_9EURY|nr:30S ribosomal protein S3 [Halolamina pelagica]
MADEQQFIENGLQRSQIDEFFADELSRAGYGGMDIAKTPMGTQIVLKAEKPGMVIGKGGKNIRKITTELEDRFDMEDPQIDVQEVDEPDLNAQIVADRLANALERGWYFRKAGHTTIDRMMEAGALGAEIVLSGKVTGARSRVEKFNRGYIKHNGEPAQSVVDEGQGVAVMKLGTIGVTVKVIGPDATLPDDFEITETDEAPRSSRSRPARASRSCSRTSRRRKSPRRPSTRSPRSPTRTPRRSSTRRSSRKSSRPPRTRSRSNPPTRRTRRRPSPRTSRSSKKTSRRKPPTSSPRWRRPRRRPNPTKTTRKRRSNTWRFSTPKRSET